MQSRSDFMNKAKERQLVLKAMKEIYYKDLSKRLDWMGYVITEYNKPTYHHIVKREELLKDNKDIGATLENGAYLGKRSHEMLHQIELIDHDLYECWNDLFLMINRMGIYPVEDVWKAIFHLRKLSEEAIQRQNIKNKRK
jgi:hypothetical protein